MRAASARLLPFAAFLLLVTSAVAEDTTTTTAPAAKDPPPVQETAVHGTPPDLTGRWLVVTGMELPDGSKSTLTVMWDIAMRDGKQTLTYRFVDLPPAQKAAVEALGPGQLWTPLPADLAAVRAAWDDLPPIESHVRQVQNSIDGKDGFDETLVKDARTKDAMWVIRSRQDLHASGAPIVRYAWIYAALAESGGDYTGNFNGATIAAAPFPIPISVQGSFHAYRLSQPAPSGGFLTRLLDIFRGCGKSAGN